MVKFSFVDGITPQVSVGWICALDASAHAGMAGLWDIGYEVLSFEDSSGKEIC